nr:Ty3/gypsy retrotransposon protein [Tanacetum cinerariifolium]
MARHTSSYGLTHSYASLTSPTGFPQQAHHAQLGQMWGQPSGDDPDRWIYAITEYFSLLNTPAAQHLHIVVFNLEGAMAEWFQWITSNGLITIWARFEESVKNHFGPSKYEDPNGALLKLLQLGTVEDYQREFEKLMNRARFDDEVALVAGTSAGVEADKVVNDCDDSESSSPVTPTSD